MKRHLWATAILALLAVLSSGAIVLDGETGRAAAAPLPSIQPVGGRQDTWVLSDQITATTWITVTSTADDYNDGYSQTCSDGLPEECTLRRAVNEAYTVPQGERPVAIIFDIPTSDPGYDAALDVWKITLTGTTGDDLRDLSGKTIVDGSTQPGGRSDGPKIIVDGDEHKNNGFILRYDENTVRGLAMQNFLNAHVNVASNDNIIEDGWFGLSDDGTHLSAGDDVTPEGGSGVAMASGVIGNVVRNNVLAGFFETAAAIRGSDNVFSGNLVGTRADGTVPLPAQFQQHPCLPGAWAGGIGITVEGYDNLIGGPTAAEGNRFVGLYLDATDQHPAIKVGQSGEGNIVRNNVIGLDANDVVIGVCGRGLDLGSGPQDMRVIDNVLVETRLSAILMNAASLNGNTLRGNLIMRATAWPPEQGMNPFPEDAIAYGPLVPDELRTFKPARITEVDGVSVSGTNGEGNTCGDCVVEIFMDDKDAVTETLQSLAVVTASADGTWSATLPAPLTADQGLRTMSTVPDTFTIIGLDTGTTSNLSVLYARHLVFLPVVSK